MVVDVLGYYHTVHGGKEGVKHRCLVPFKSGDIVFGEVSVRDGRKQAADGLFQGRQIGRKKTVVQRFFVA